MNDRPKTDPNHELLAQAVESMRDVASHVIFINFVLFLLILIFFFKKNVKKINDNKKRVQAIQRVAEINQKISGLLRMFFFFSSIYFKSFF